MGDKHVCSFCGEQQTGKQHVKIVFENWPVEEEVIYRRKGKETKTSRKLTKEVITAIGMECFDNPERWKDYDIDPSKVADFFEDLRFAGKNPIFSAILTKTGPVCLSSNCIHRTGSDCQYLLRHAAQWLGLDELACEIGHPGKVLVRKSKERGGLLNPMASLPGARQSCWKTILGFLTLDYKGQSDLLTKIYFTFTYSVPMLVILPLYMLVAYPLWGLLCLKNKVSLMLGRMK